MLTKSRRKARSDSASATPERRKPLSKPRKRPTQDRAKFTIEALYDAFVRIWKRDGAEAATTRAVAEEAGFAVGTLYEYFPDRLALYSGYVRHCVETLLAQIDARVIAGEGAWRTRLALLVGITCGAAADAPFFDIAMLRLEGEIAEAKHHRRVFEEISAKWAEAIRGWSDLKPQPSTAAIDALVLAVWGARRYRLLLEAPGRLGDWVEQVGRLCESALERGGSGEESIVR
jgi:AcrR family transcriptional regulator